MLVSFVHFLQSINIRLCGVSVFDNEWKYCAGADEDLAFAIAVAVYIINSKWKLARDKRMSIAHLSSKTVIYLWCDGIGSKAIEGFHEIPSNIMKSVGNNDRIVPFVQFQCQWVSWQSHTRPAFLFTCMLMYNNPFYIHSFTQLQKEWIKIKPC